MTKPKKKATPKATPKKPIPRQLGFFERIWKWLKDRIK
jgi:hypothetical protein